MRVIEFQDIIDHYKPGPGRHWFDRDTLRFWRTKLPSVAYQTEDGKKAYFVTSELAYSNGIRRYTVRSYNFKLRKIYTIGEFQFYDHRKDAVEAAKCHARNKLSYEITI